MATLKRKHTSTTTKVVFGIVLIFSIFFFYPMIYVIINSLRESADITRFPTGLPNSFYMGNYIKAWNEMEFPKVFLNTFFITTAGVVGIILTSSMCAYMLARTTTKTSWIIYSIFTFALVIPFQIIMVPIAVLASDFNLTNTPGIILMYWGLGCPTAIFMFHGFVKSVPRELEESAAIDGAGRFYTFFVIVLPLLKTIIATIAVIDALWIWNDFLLPLLVLREGTIQLAQMRFNGQFLKDYGAMTASLTISSLPIILFYLFLQKYIIKGIAAGAVKG